MLSRGACLVVGQPVIGYSSPSYAVSHSIIHLEAHTSCTEKYAEIVNLRSCSARTCRSFMQCACRHLCGGDVQLL